MDRTTIRYSEAFRRQVVDELERGKHSSIEKARRVYGIHGLGARSCGKAGTEIEGVMSMWQ